jgi:RND family efflux transporter MFP subunit
MSQIVDIPPMPPSNEPGAAPHGHPAHHGSGSHNPKKSGKSGLIIFSIVVVAVLGVAVAQSLHSRVKAANELKRSTLEDTALPFNVVHPSAVLSSGEISLPGSAMAFMDTAIYARTNGYLKNWNVDIGAHVKQGDVLAEIETPEVDRQLEQARGDLQNAQANLNLSEITERRSQDLFKNKTISSQERDTAISDLAAKRALVTSGEANVHRLEQLKAFEKVGAPFDGVITARSTDVGALIQASGAKELFHLSDNHILRVYFSVPEVYASTIKHGDDVQITFDSFPNEKFTGKLIRDSESIDPLSHTLNVEADVDNRSGKLYPGGYATVHLKIPGTKGAVTIPANTLLFRSEGTQVAVIRNGRVELVKIEIGHDFGNTLEVTSGLVPADAVILDPPDSLAEGTPARIPDTAKDAGKAGS